MVLAKRKELHYFTYDKVLKFKNKGPKDAEMHKFHTRTFDEYKDQYKTVANEKAIGDISPTYALYGEALEYLKDTLGEKRSEERRVGKSVDLGGRSSIKKKEDGI